MDITFAHYRNRFCMFRTYYAFAIGAVKLDGINMKVIEMPDPPSREQEEALINGDVQAANLYLPNFLQRKLQGAPIVGLCTEWKSTLKGNGMFVRKDSPVKRPEDLVGRLIGSHQGPARFSSIPVAPQIWRGRLTTQLGVASSGETSVRRIEGRQGRRSGVARPVLFSRRRRTGCALSLHRRRGLAGAARLSAR